MNHPTEKTSRFNPLIHFQVSGDETDPSLRIFLSRDTPLPHSPQYLIDGCEDMDFSQGMVPVGQARVLLTSCLGGFLTFPHHTAISSVCNQANTNNSPLHQRHPESMMHNNFVSPGQ
jgi:hypothetical protein